MARLNEPAASVETLDALKRRFVRQNREIARVNSTQSLRIRDLEGEISRLLSENMALRERIISLQYEVDKRPGRSDLDDMGIVKERLEAKLTELGGLVQELGRIQVAVKNPRSLKRKSMSRTEPKGSPDQRNFKNNLTLSEVIGGGDGRLPPIVEDKYFPRKTLDAEEILEIFPDQANVTDSPELGPPPVAHFEEGDVVKFDTARGFVPPTDAEAGHAQHPMFANLETRRKRRESTNMAKTNVHGTTDPQSLESDASSSAEVAAPVVVQPLRSSAKRKFNTTEEENKSSSETAEKSSQVENNFMFGRSTQVLAGLNKSVPAKSAALKKGDGLQLNHTASQDSTTEEAARDRKVKEVVAETMNNRKALGPKSVNTDPTSPAKVARFGSTNKVPGSKDEVMKRFPSRNRLKDKASKPVPAPQEITVVNALSIPAKVAPDTPVVLSHDIVCPSSSEPSAVRLVSRDTPPPSDFQPGASSKGVFGTNERATRRPRGSVSYAEPNLRDKMRRPTKDLIDAVGACDRPQHLATIKLEGNNSVSNSVLEKGAPRATNFKEESDANASDLWQIPTSTQSQEQQHQPVIVEPISPLGSKSSIPPAELPTSVITNRRRRTVGVHHNEAEGAEQGSHQNHPGAGSTILALAGGSQRPRRREEDKGVREGEVERQEIVKESSGSSPADGFETDDEKRMQESATGPSTTLRNLRRYSTVAGEERSTTTTTMGESKGGGGNGGPVARKRERKKETVGSGGGARGDGGVDLKSVRSVAGLNPGGGVVVEESTGRAERAALRRRSMML